MVGRRWGRECSCWLKHLKAQRGLTLPLGSGGVNMRIADEDDGDDDKEDKYGNGKNNAKGENFKENVVIGRNADQC